MLKPCSHSKSFRFQKLIKFQSQRSKNLAKRIMKRYGKLNEIQQIKRVPISTNTNIFVVSNCIKCVKIRK